MARLHNKALFAVLQQLRHATSGRAYDGQARCHCFDNGKRIALVIRAQRENICRAQHVRDVSSESEEMDAVGQA